MDWFDYPYPRPDLMSRWSLARHSEVMAETFHNEDSKKKFDIEVHSLFKSVTDGKPRLRADLCSLFECFYAAAKMEKREDPACENRLSFDRLYSKGLQSFLESYIHDPPCCKKDPNENDVIFYCMALVVDISKNAVRSLHTVTDVDPRRLKNILATLRSLPAIFDKETLFHKMNKLKPLPSWILFHPRQYTKTFAVVGEPNQDRNFVPLDGKARGCSCQTCQTQSHESYLWINTLVEYFARSSEITGFDLFLETLVKMSRLETIKLDALKVCQVILQFFCKILELLKDETKAEFLTPCLKMLGAISRWNQTNQLTGNFVGTVTLITQHLRFIFASLLPPALAQAIMVKSNTLLRDLMMSFQSMEIPGTAHNHSLPWELERPHPAISAAIAGAMRDEHGRQMHHLLTKFISELVTTVQQSRPVLASARNSSMRMKLAEAGEAHTFVVAYPSNHPIPELCAKKADDNLSAASNRRSSASLGGTMRHNDEIVSESGVPTRSLSCGNLPKDSTSVPKKSRSMSLPSASKEPPQEPPSDV